jgi:phospholipid N-methyltransferase
MRETVHFLQQFLAQFRQTGALFPSSQLLARAMVNNIPPLKPGEVIVELGPGTGVFTRELSRRFPMHLIVAIEFNHTFAARLQERMPRVCVVEGCASQLRHFLEELEIKPETVGSIVSGLPLLSLPAALRDEIFAGIASCLLPGKRYIQFTYSKRAWKHVSPPGFRLERTQKVWLNLPPAEVLPFTRTAA